MPQWRPDQTFYPSPKMAMQASPETTAFVAMLDPTRTMPDALAVVDVDRFQNVWPNGWTRGHAQFRR